MARIRHGGGPTAPGAYDLSTARKQGWNIPRTLTATPTSLIQELSG